MTGYKLTDKNGYTFNLTLWGENVTHETNGTGDLCGPGWLHAYGHPLIAELMDPIHANFGPTGLLWECRIEGDVKRDGQLKLGCTKMTTLRRVERPSFPLAARVRFAILCAKTVYWDPGWNAWADNWLSGKSRGKAAADVAASVAWAASGWAASAASVAAASAPWAAATRASATEALRAVARAASEAARAAVWTVGAAVWTDNSIVQLVESSVVQLIERSIAEEGGTA